MKEKLGMALGAVCLIGFPVLAFFLAGFLLDVLLWISNYGSKWMVTLSILYLPFSLFVLLPLAAFTGTRRFASGGMRVGGYVFGTTLWLLCIALTFAQWGKTVTVVGLFFLGIGIIPIGVVAGFFANPWYMGFLTIILGALAFGASLAADHFDQQQ